MFARLVISHFKYSCHKRISSYQVNRFCTKPNNATQVMVEILKNKFPKAVQIDVVDVSGGCGAMYEILVESSEFKGLSTVKQHRLINEALKDQIKEMHGLRIHTVISNNDSTAGEIG